MTFPLALGCIVATLYAAQTAAAQNLDAATDVVAMVGGKSVTAAELDQAARDRLFKVRNEEYTIRRQALDEHVNRLLLEQEAARRGVSVEELVRLEVDAKTLPVTPEQTRAVYDSQPSRFGPQATPQVLAQIETGLRQTRQAESRRRFIDGIRQRTGVRLLLEPPRLAIDARGGPSKGPATAAVEVVEFSDFQCPYCRQAVETLKRLEADYRDRVRIVFRDFPLPNHREAPKAAEAAACADDQGQFWAMHDRLFATQSTLQIPDLKRRAAELGLNTTQFDECLDSGRHAARWQENRALGQRLGVSGTPSFFINGRLVVGNVPYDSLRTVIDEELSRAAPPNVGNR